MRRLLLQLLQRHDVTYHAMRPHVVTWHKLTPVQRRSHIWRTYLGCISVSQSVGRSVGRGEFETADSQGPRQCNRVTSSLLYSRQVRIHGTPVSPCRSPSNDECRLTIAKTRRRTVQYIRGVFGADFVAPPWLKRTFHPTHAPRATNASNARKHATNATNTADAKANTQGQSGRCVCCVRCDAYVHYVSCVALHENHAWCAVPWLIEERCGRLHTVSAQSCCRSRCWRSSYSTSSSSRSIVIAHQLLDVDVDRQL